MEQPETRPQLVCLWLALLSLIAMLGWQEMVIRYHYHGNQTGLFCTGSKLVQPPSLRAGTYLFKDSYGYDGEFYRYMAYDPFFQRGFDRYIDDPRLRYGRPLVPVIAWALAAGHDGAIDRTYQYTVAVLCAMGVYWTASYLLVAGCPPWWGMALFLLLPATLTSMDRLLLDGPVCALFAGFFYYLKRGRWGPLYVIAVLAPLVKETGLLIPAALVAAEVLKRHWKRAVIFATAAIPVLLWARFVAMHSNPTAATHVFSRPVVGLLVRLFEFHREYAVAATGWLVAIKTVSLLSVIGYLLCLAMAGIWVWSLVTEEGWTPVTIVMAGFLAFALVTGSPSYLTEAYGFARPISPMLLWMAMQALIVRRWAALAPPVLLNGGVGMYVAYPTMRAIMGMWG